MLVPTISRTPVSIGTDDDMKPVTIPLLLICLLLVCGCRDEKEEPQLLLFTHDFDFNQGMHEWGGGFADFPADPVDSAQFELKYGYSEPVDSKLTKRSVMLSGKNVNRDLFMYLKKKIDGLQPHRDYTLTFNVELASDMNATVPSPGGAIYLKAGASGFEPETVSDGTNYVINIDKGNADFPGTDMISLGEISPTTSGTSYTLFTRNNSLVNSRYIARANAQGELWLVIGTDSSLEGRTSFYYTRINVVFSAS